MHLYMIRHGQSHVNLPEWNGGFDEGLTELGHRQAVALATWMPGAIPGVDAIYSSTMLRARETVAPLAAAYGLPVNFDERLREVGTSRLDHTPWPSESLLAYADYWASERPFAPVTPDQTGSETLMHFRTRVGLFIEELVSNHQEQVVVAVCHGGVIEVTFDHVFNVGAFRHCEVWNHNTGVAHFEYVAHPRRETWRLHAHNRVDHLLLHLAELESKQNGAREREDAA
jgi:2,3-bisphosphoglycerate-dependent phosphoglycerate mutase